MSEKNCGHSYLKSEGCPICRGAAPPQGERPGANIHGIGPDTDGGGWNPDYVPPCTCHPWEGIHAVDCESRTPWPPVVPAHEGNPLPAHLRQAVNAVLFDGKKITFEITADNVRDWQELLAALSAERTPPEREEKP